MINQLLFGTLVAITLLFPSDIQSALMDGADEKEDTKQFVLPDILDEIESIDTKAEGKTDIDINETSAPTDVAAEQVEAWAEKLPKIDEESHQADFINAIASAAVLIAHEHGIYPSVMIAQASLESGWGRSDLAQKYNNLMGTKGSWEGENVTVRTREDVNGKSVYIEAGFSVYDSWADSLKRYGTLMEKGLDWDNKYYKGTWRENAETYLEATAWLEGRYATDSAYAEKLNGTIESYALDQFDEIEPLAEYLEEPLKYLTVQES